MILLIHNSSKVVEVKDLTSNVLISISETNPVNALFLLSKKYIDSILVWCHNNQKDNINFETLKSAFHLKNMMMSYVDNHYLPDQIGYVEDSPFLKFNKAEKYPTWLMSSQVGAIYANQLIKFKDVISAKNDFDYALNSIAKLGMVKGLFCYSEPRLLKDSRIKQTNNKANTSKLFKFVKQHYKTRWIFLLLINLIWHEKRVPFLSALNSFFFKRIKTNVHFGLEPLLQIKGGEDPTIDVLIPTIGRKKYLYDVLKDLKAQTLLPKQVIIVEQNPDNESSSDLGFIKKETWPFKIVHKFIHQTGACNARNLALRSISSKYVFFADDDIRFKENVLKDAIDFMSLNKINATTLSCLRPTDKVVFTTIFQWPSFGSGCSIVKKEALKGTKFNMAFEYGFGEDADFGMQLRNNSVDIIYYPKVNLTHLKAPIGGFRFKHTHPWEIKKNQPKPSPTVMLNRILNTSNHQLLGYKTTLFIKFYREQKIINPLLYYKKFKKQWQQSIFWANKLKEKNI